MYSKLNLDKEQIELLRQYFNAFSNLYGIITMRKAFEIISGQNQGSISEEDFIAFAEIARHENHYYYILSMDELYTAEPPSKPMERELVGDGTGKARKPLYTGLMTMWKSRMNF